MFNRIILTACVCLAGSLSAFGQSNQGSGYLFELPGSTSASGQFYYSAGTATAFPASPTSVPGGPVGLSQITPRPDGGQFYLVNPGNLQTADPAFAHFVSVNLDQAPTAVTVTPDGKHVLAGTDQFYIIDASTNQIVATLPLPGPPNFSADQAPGTPACPSCWIAVSRDSSTAYVLTNGANARVTAINLNTHTLIASPPPLSLQFADATGIALSPLGLLYVTAANRIYEINPATLTVTPSGTTQLSFWPTRLKFTPDGTAAFAVNYTPATGGESLMEFTPANYGVSYWPAYNAILHPFVPGTPAVLFSDVFVAGNSRAFALSSPSSPATPNTLYDVSLNPLNAATSVIGATNGVAVNDVNSADISNELPAPQFLYLLTSQNVIRINLGASNAASSQTTPSSANALEFALVPPETGAASFLQFNNNQTPAAGATSAPLIARVLNAAGQPVFNLPVSFAADATSAAAGLVVTTPSATTGADGYVQTTVTAPTAAGSYHVVLTAGSATATFALTVACTGTSCSSGGGSGSGSSQVTIVSGNGQLVSATSPATQFPMFLQVTDTSGNPLANVPVTFSVTGGSGTLFNSSAATDQNGLASTLFSPQLTTSSSFQTDTINALTSYGQVNFTVTEVPIATVTPVLIQPVDLVNPSDVTNTFTVPEGSVLPNAFEAIINSDIGASMPIPGIGIDILGPDQVTSSTAAKCQGSPLSDATGTVICNIVAACQASNISLPQNYQVYFDVGGGYEFFGGTIKITPGTASKLNKTSGDGQHGTPGQTLPLALGVTVTDGCGSPAAGNTVKWTVSPSNGATLVNTTTVSNSSGQVSTQVTLGQVAGTVTVTASFGTATAVFTVTNQIVASGISLVSGSGQTALTGQGFAQPVVFLAHDASGNPVAGAAVSFSATNGATVSPVSGFTNAQGLASITVTAGTAVGSVVATATLGSFSTTATLTVQPPGPAITASSFVSSASGAVGLVACGLGSVFGNGIAPNVQGVVSGLNPLAPLPYTLSGFSMTINNIPVPIQALANQNGQQQANFQTPCETQPGTATVVVTANGAIVTVTGVQVLAAQPGQYPSPVQGTPGITYGTVISATDGSLVTLTNPAHRGQDYYLIATGLGQVSPAAQTDSVGVAGQNVVLPVVVGVADQGVPVISATYAQGATGAYLVKFQIPSDAPTGTNQHLALAVVINNQLVFGNTLTLPAVQ